MGNGCYSYGIVIHDRYMGYDICRFICVIDIYGKTQMMLHHAMIWFNMLYTWYNHYSL